MKKFYSLYCKTESGDEYLWALLKNPTLDINHFLNLMLGEESLYIERVICVDSENTIIYEE